jgi:hypothetical protein
MPAPNYRFEKRQRELAQAKKKEEKRLKKEARKGTPEGETPEAPAATPEPGQPQ